MNRRAEVRTLRPTIRFSPAEWRRVCSLAERAGIRASSWVRAGALREPSDPPRAPRTGRTRFREPRSRRCEIRFHAAEWERVERLATTLSLPPARFIREAAVGYNLAARINSEAVHQLARVGNVLNQLARVAHAEGQVTESDALHRALAALHHVLDELL